MQKIPSNKLIQYSKKLEEVIPTFKKMIIETIKCCKIAIKTYSMNSEKKDIITIDKNKINKDYINYYLRFINSYSTKIPVPPIKNQLKIIEYCNSSITRINNMEEMITKYIDEINKIKSGVYD